MDYTQAQFFKEKNYYFGIFHFFLDIVFFFWPPLATGKNHFFALAAVFLVSSFFEKYFLGGAVREIYLIIKMQ